MSITQNEHNNTPGLVPQFPQARQTVYMLTPPNPLGNFAYMLRQPYTADPHLLQVAAAQHQFQHSPQLTPALFRTQSPTPTSSQQLQQNQLNYFQIQQQQQQQSLQQKLRLEHEQQQHQLQQQQQQQQQNQQQQQQHKQQQLQKPQQQPKSSHKQQQNNTNNNQHNQEQQTPQNKTQTNDKIRAIKEKCIAHYIDGQLILETSAPLNQRKKHKILDKKKIKKETRKDHVKDINKEISKNSIKPELRDTAKDIANNNRDVPTKNKDFNDHPIPQHKQLQPQQPQQPQRLETPRDSSMSVNQVTQYMNDPQEIRAEMANWSIDDVVAFIERHDDIRDYSSRFADHEIDGKALLLMIDRNLNFQTLASMFKHGPAMKIEATLCKYKANDTSV